MRSAVPYLEEVPAVDGVVVGLRDVLDGVVAPRGLVHL